MIIVRGISSLEFTDVVQSHKPIAAVCLTALILLIPSLYSRFAIFGLLPPPTPFSLPLPPLSFPSISNVPTDTPQMSGISLLGGISAYTRYNSVPSLLASFGIGGLMGISSMRIRDGMERGLEGATGPSAPLDDHPLAEWVD